MTNLALTLDRLKKVDKDLREWSLDRMIQFLDVLGNPHQKMPPVIHVAGTNGKGSTVAFLRSMCEAAGLRVHVYTSPHLVRFNERIRLGAPGGGRLIADDDLVELCEECESYTSKAPVSFFELTTAAAFLAFSRVPADVALVEVGLGGRLDATNVFDRPAATVVTRLSYDHCAVLGTTLSAIGTEKAAIFRSGVPAVMFPQPADEARSILLEKASALGAVPYVGSQDWRVTETDEGFDYASPYRHVSFPKPALLGSHQVLNAGTAVATLESVPFLNIQESHIRQGLASVDWPARLQQLKWGPLAEILPPKWELWLDGGHNDSGGEVLGDHLCQWRREDSKKGRAAPVFIIYGMLHRKIPQEFLAPLREEVAALRAIAIPDEPDSLSAAESAKAALDTGFRDVAAMDTPRLALQSLVTSYAVQYPQARVLICGSLYLAGAILADHGS